MEAASPPPGPKAPAGWYPDPDQVQTQRFWDGTDWTEQRAPLGDRPVDDDHIEVELPPVAFLILAGVVAAIVAVFLPFVDAKGPLPIQGNTLIQRGEGIVIVILAVVAVLALYRRITGARWWWATAAIGVVLLAVVVYTGVNRPETSYSLGGRTITSTIEKPAPGVGIYLAGIGAVLITVGGLALPRTRTI
jgi:hypothetical protein